MASQRVAPLETSLFRLETTGHPIGLVAITACEGPAPTLDRLRERVEKLIPSTPRFRAVAQPVPLSFERPVWADPPDFSIADHVTASRFEATDGKDPVEA